MSRVCTECNKHGTCAKERKVASGKGWCSKFYQSRRALEADRDALRAELDLVRGAIRADDERLYAAWVRIHGAPSDCANIGCDAPEWMADEILRLRAELDRTKGELDDLRELARYVAYPESRFTTQVPFSGDEGRWASSLCKRHAIGNDALRDTFEKGDRA